MFTLAKTLSFRRMCGAFSLDNGHTVYKNSLTLINPSSSSPGVVSTASWRRPHTRQNFIILTRSSLLLILNISLTFTLNFSLSLRFICVVLSVCFDCYSCAYCRWGTGRGSTGKESIAQEAAAVSIRNEVNTKVGVHQDPPIARYHFRHLFPVLCAICAILPFWILHMNNTSWSVNRLFVFPPSFYPFNGILTELAGRFLGPKVHLNLIPKYLFPTSVFYVVFEETCPTKTDVAHLYLFRI